jgi:Raf kinase inhibitor-like YbhB/YbcL family protein
MAFPIAIPAFEEGEMIPAKYTCEGENRSPVLTWSDLPEGTRSLALVLDDPDAPSARGPDGAFVHWVLYNIPPSLNRLAEGQAQDPVLPGVGTHGINSYGRTGYTGPCPPRGSVHRYYFHLYALDTAPTLPGGLTAAQLRKTIQGRILSEATWVGKYGR